MYMHIVAYCLVKIKLKSYLRWTGIAIWDIALCSDSMITLPVQYQLPFSPTLWSFISYCRGRKRVSHFLTHLDPFWRWCLNGVVKKTIWQGLLMYKYTPLYYLTCAFVKKNVHKEQKNSWKVSGLFFFQSTWKWIITDFSWRSIEPQHLWICYKS